MFRYFCQTCRADVGVLPTWPTHFFRSLKTHWNDSRGRTAHFATLNRHGNIVKELLAARAAQVADHDGGKLRVLEQTHCYQVFNLEQFDKYSSYNGHIFFLLLSRECERCGCTSNQTGRASLLSRACRRHTDFCWWFGSLEQLLQ